MKTIIEVSVRDAKKAADAINDCNEFRDKLEQTASNVWEYEYHDDCEEEAEENNTFILDLEDQFRMFGVEEYEIVEQ